jgi:DNA-binding LytR/AlgR family response regulator
MINKYCKDYNLELELYDYENGHKLLSDFKHEKFKLIFLDIYMDDINGIEIAKEIRLHDSDIIIIFMTTSKDHALDAFEVDAMQYLVKPVDYKKLHNIFNKFQKLFTDNMRFIEVPSNGLSVKIFLKDIYYIEVYNKTSLIHTNLQTIKTYTPLSKLWELLGKDPFLRCHRSYIVNMFYIDDILENDFLLKNGDKIPIRREAYSDIKQIYSDYFFEKMRNDI